MAADHVDIHIPYFPAWHDVVVYLSECESVSHARHSGFSSYPSPGVSHFLLGFHYTDYQTFSDFKSLQWMWKWFNSWVIDHGVSSIEELWDISADIPVQYKLSTGVKSLITIQIED